MIRINYKGMSIWVTVVMLFLGPGWVRVGWTRLGKLSEMISREPYDQYLKDSVQ